MALQYGIILLLIVACWAIAPGLICKRRLRAFDIKGAWGLIIGGVLGPLGVAVINIYLSFQALSLNIGQRQSLVEHWRGEKRKFSLRSDMLALACLCAVVWLGSTLFTVGSLNAEAQMATRQVDYSQLSVMPTQQISGATAPQDSGTAAPQTVESLSLLASNQTTHPKAVVTRSGEVTRLNQRQPAAQLPTIDGETVARSSSSTEHRADKANCYWCECRGVNAIGGAI
jgi:hypothetical protein